MPCYNSEPYVEKAIKSVIEQSYNNWELIAINDGSTDLTKNILQSYASNDQRIKIICKDNGGYAIAVNTGLDNLSGDYCLMMGSDDTITPNLLRKLNKNIRSCNINPDCIAFQTEINNSKIDPVTSFDSVIFSEKTSLKAFFEKYPNMMQFLFALCFSIPLPTEYVRYNTSSSPHQL